MGSADLVVESFAQDDFLMMARARTNVVQQGHKQSSAYCAGIRDSSNFVCK